VTADEHRISVRPFRPEDQFAAQELILAGLEEHWGYLDPTKNPDLDDIASTYADGLFLVAHCGDELVGTGALTREADGTAHIVRMSVAAHARRRGIGTLILCHLCEQARALGHRQILVETTSTWNGAIAFYERHGFQAIGSYDGDTYFVLDLASFPGAAQRAQQTREPCHQPSV
jgi:GNAT superfamily N-acetyltransferase